MSIKNLKLALGITANTVDDELTSLIEACKIDLKLAGVNKIDINDALIFRAVVFYCKANFWSDSASENYRKAYDNLKTAMALSGEYGG